VDKAIRELLSPVAAVHQGFQRIASGQSSNPQSPITGLEHPSAISDIHPKR
jgi:hypothetical protein